MREVLAEIGDAINKEPPDYERLRRIIDAAPARMTGFNGEHRDAAFQFLAALEYALDRVEARSLSERGRLQ